MARIPFQKPKTIHWEILSDRYGRLMAEPFEKGYGQTVGHSLRRTLLSIMPRGAVTWSGQARSRTPQPDSGVQEGTVDVSQHEKLAVKGRRGSRWRRGSRPWAREARAPTSRDTGLVLNPRVTSQRSGWTLCQSISGSV